MGPRQSDILEAVFGLLFKMSLEIPIFLRHRQSFAANDGIKQDLALAYAEMLMVTSDAIIYCMKQNQGMEVFPAKFRACANKMDRSFSQAFPWPLRTQSGHILPIQRTDLYSTMVLSPAKVCRDAGYHH